MKIRTYLNTIVFSIIFLQLILVPAAGAANKIMPLGDSITWDDRDNDTRSDGEKIAYRYRLWQLLTDAGYEIDFVGSEYTGYDFFPDAENEGHPGWTDDDIAASVYDFLSDNPAKIILLHIGTNDLNPDPGGVENILDEIDRYEADFGITITVILARIINRSTYSAMTTLFNDNVENMAFSRVNDPTNPAYPDRIIFGVNVDMEDGAGIDYRLLEDVPPGDMWDNIHPFEGVDSGYSKMGNVWFSVLVEILPQADAGPDQSVNEFETVTLDASDSFDPKGGNLSYQWTQTAGTPVVDLDPDAQAVQPTFEAPDAGLTSKTLTFTLTVTDEDALVSTDTVDIIVAKILPQADAGPNQTVSNSATVTLDATGSVGVGLSYQWTQTAGTDVVLSDDTAIQPTFVADADPGGETLTFELTVTDDDGIDSTDTVNIAVNNFQADAGPDQNVDEFDTVTLDASGSVPAGDLSYQWTQTAGTTVPLSDAQAVKPTFAAPNVGSSGETLTFKLTVTDVDNLESTDTVNIRVHNPTSPDDGGGGGGGGGGCFIATAAYGSSMASGGITSLVAFPSLPAAIPEIVVAMVVFTSLCAAIALRKRRKKWIKPDYRRYPNLAHN